jgi:hypothetical protein
MELEHSSLLITATGIMAVVVCDYHSLQKPNRVPINEPTAT